MFLFATNAAKVDQRLLRSSGQSLGKVNILCKGGAALFWIQDVFTHFSEASGRIRIDVQRPKIDKGPICRLDWQIDSGTVVVRRRWSGEFTVYVASKPNLAIASHLRLISAAFGGVPPRTKRLKAGWRVSVNYARRSGNPQFVSEVKYESATRRNYRTSARLARVLLARSVRRHAGSIALLLSGGVDSSVLAALASRLGKRLHAFVFSMRQPLRRQALWERDLLHARKVAAHCHIPCTEILLSSRTVVKNMRIAVWLGETARGTIVDPCAAMIEVAQTISRAGFSQVWLAEAADDLFGGFDFAFRYFHGRKLTSYFRRELTVGLPDEMAILQKIFEPWGISVVDPFWTMDLLRLGYSLPVRYRIDSRRHTKLILRHAFADILPMEIVRRPKGVTRDTTQVRYALENHFGRSRYRYRSVFSSFFGPRAQWPARMLSTLQKISRA